MGDYDEMRKDEQEQKIAAQELKESTENLQKAIAWRVAAGNAEAVEALKRLTRWCPEVGFPENIRPAYFDQMRKEGGGHWTIKAYKKDAMLNEAPFASETYTYELWGKEEGRTYLALLGQLARALGLEGLHDRRLR